MPSSNNMEVVRRIVTAIGTTDVGGDFAVSFNPSFPAIPHIAPAILNQDNPNQKIRVLSASGSGCTVRVEVQDQTFLALLGVDVLTASVTPINGASVCVMATAQA